MLFLHFCFQGRFIEPSLQRCSKTECEEPPYSYVVQMDNKLLLDIRRYLRKYYSVSMQKILWFWSSAQF